jgi:hypothetical protein
LTANDVPTNDSAENAGSDKIRLEFLHWQRRIGELFSESGLLQLRSLDPWAEEKTARISFYVFRYAISNIEAE